MIAPTLVYGLSLMTAVVWSPVRAAADAEFRAGQSPWLRTDSRHFEIHYPPALAGELDRVTRTAERAYDRISERLDFVFAKKVPLVFFEPTGPLTREAAVAYAVSDTVAPQRPHRSRLVLPLPERAGELEALILHELTHLLFSEIILPEQPGDGGLPRWIHEGIAHYMAGTWSEDHVRLMRDLVASGKLPRLSQLSGTGEFADERSNDALGHAAFDYIERRWGRGGIRRFVNALIVPRVDRTYDVVLDLTPAEFDEAFREYVERRFVAAGR